MARHELQFFELYRHTNMIIHILMANEQKNTKLFHMANDAPKGKLERDTSQKPMPPKRK